MPARVHLEMSPALTATARMAATPAHPQYLGHLAAVMVEALTKGCVWKAAAIVTRGTLAPLATTVTLQRCTTAATGALLTR